jgi:hypothetical protein
VSPGASLAFAGMRTWQMEGIGPYGSPLRVKDRRGENMEGKVRTALPSDHCQGPVSKGEVMGKKKQKNSTFSWLQLQSQFTI